MSYRSKERSNTRTYSCLYVECANATLYGDGAGLCRCLIFSVKYPCINRKGFVLMVYSDEIKNEALRRLEILQAQGLDKTVVENYKKGKYCFSCKAADNAVLHYEVSQDAKVSEAVQKIESEYHVHVYYAVCNEMAWGLLVTALAEPFPKKRTRKCRKKRNESLIFFRMLVHAA